MTSMVGILLLLAIYIFHPIAVVAAPGDAVEIVLGTLPKNYKADSLVVSGDGSQFAFVIQTTDGERVVENSGQQGKIFDQIAVPEFSPVTNKLFYWALDAPSGQQRIVLVAGGEVIPTPYAGKSSLVFSNDGKRWVAVGGVLRGQTSGEVVFLIDGKETRRYIDATYPSFSPDGEHLAYLVRRSSSLISFVIDGHEQLQYEVNPEAEKECSPAFMSSVAGPNMPPLFAVHYLTDGSRIIVTQDQNCWTVYRGNQPVASYMHNVWGGLGLQVLNFSDFETKAAIWSRSLTLACAAPVVGWWERMAGEEDRWRVVKDGKPVSDTVCAFFWAEQKPVISADGSHIAYPCYKKTGTDQAEVSVITDNQEYGPYQYVWGVTLSGSGEDVAFAVSEGSESQPWSYSRNGQMFAAKYDSASGPVLSADGVHVA